MTIRLVLADDHPLVLKGLELLFSTEPDFTVLACQATPKTAPLTTIEIAPLDYSGYSGFRKPVLA